MSKRLFFAIPIPEPYRIALLRSFKRESTHGIRWVGMENLHITLHFLGRRDDPEFVKEQARLICDSNLAFECTFEEFKVIRKNGKPVMIWAAFLQSESFSSLVFSLRNSFPTEETRIPQPHCTLARIKQLHQLPFDLSRGKPFSFHVDAVQLWESHLHASGSSYQIVAEWKLGRGT